MSTMKMGILLLALLLAACGSAKSGASEHAGHGQAQGQAKTEGHSAGAEGHGEHTGASQPAADTQVVWKLNPEQPQAGQDTQVSMEVRDAKGEPVEKFDTNHEKLMHLIVVSKDLSYFDHLHPAYEGKGRFDITTKLPAGGEYKLFADYVPAGGSATTGSEWVKAEGTAPAARPLEPDSQLTRTVEGKEVTLTTGTLAAGQEVMLTFHLSDAETKQPIRNLEPYLGAVGHVVILDAAAEQYLHVHPVDEKATGPEAQFMTTFPKSGTYKIWGQFQQSGRTFIVPFTVKVG
ncbi:MULTISPECIES: hypothetical protein [Paenibacillus]|uniref:hypothetical protein n=1 Tax=Paenibacillus TaxID=44249 RepID=UPI0022B8DEDE|nr:hypothetical protein [Paenibacillus caseinilyticus]MCZ8522829.1 hypothetical protein [Paenibacillus caseinilyticus]